VSHLTLGDPKVLLSRYVFLIRDAVPGEHVLYDVIGDRYLGVDQRTLDAIHEWRHRAPAEGAEAEAAATLAELGFLVADRAADDQRFEASRARSAEGAPGEFAVALMPTLACNLACSYCYQAEHPAQGKMSEETESAALAWILRRLFASGARRLFVHYIGGEPLLRKDFLLRTARALAAQVAPRGIEFTWHITTNGIGLEPAFVRELSALGRGSLKLTLDGDEETHDAVRIYRNGRGTFEQVFQALSAVARECPEVSLQLGGNVRPGMEASCRRLLDRLEGAGLGGRIDRLFFQPVMGLAFGCGEHCGQESSRPTELTQLAHRRGLTKKLLTGVDAVSPCELHWRNSYAIDPAGLVYKCGMIAGRTELAIGSVRDDEQRPDPLVAARPWNACGEDCPFAPICLGGCLAGRYLQTGRTGSVLCHRPSLEATFRSEIAERYRQEFHPELAQPAEEIAPAEARP